MVTLPVMAPTVEAAAVVDKPFWSVLCSLLSAAEADTQPARAHQTRLLLLGKAGLPAGVGRRLNADVVACAQCSGAVADDTGALDVDVLTSGYRDRAATDSAAHVEALIAGFALCGGGAAQQARARACVLAVVLMLLYGRLDAHTACRLQGRCALGGADVAGLQGDVTPGSQADVVGALQVSAAQGFIQTLRAVLVVRAAGGGIYSNSVFDGAQGDVDTGGAGCLDVYLRQAIGGVQHDGPLACRGGAVGPDLRLGELQCGAPGEQAQSCRHGELEGLPSGGRACAVAACTFSAGTFSACTGRLGNHHALAASGVEDDSMAVFVHDCFLPKRLSSSPCYGSRRTGWVLGPSGRTMSPG